MPIVSPNFFWLASWSHLGVFQHGGKLLLRLCGGIPERRGWYLPDNCQRMWYQSKEIKDQVFQRQKRQCQGLNSLYFSYHSNKDGRVSWLPLTYRSGVASSFIEVIMISLISFCSKYTPPFTLALWLRLYNWDWFQLKGESKKTFKKYAKISWTKDNEPWNPKSEGKEKLNGFTIRFIFVVFYLRLYDKTIRRNAFHRLRLSYCLRRISWPVLLSWWVENRFQ